MAFKLDLDFETWGQESSSNRAGVGPLGEDLGARPYGGRAGGQGDIKQSGCRDRADQVEMGPAS